MRLINFMLFRVYFRTKLRRNIKRETKFDKLLINWGRMLLKLETYLQILTSIIHSEHLNSNSYV